MRREKFLSHLVPHAYIREDNVVIGDTNEKAGIAVVAANVLGGFVRDDGSAIFPFSGNFMDVIESMLKHQGLTKSEVLTDVSPR